jgi:hypothetical protein
LRTFSYQNYLYRLNIANLNKLRFNPLNLPPLLPDDNNQRQSRRFKRTGSVIADKSIEDDYVKSSMPQRRSVMVNRSMKSDNASSSKRGFMTPSTNDSRQIIISKKSKDHMNKILQNTVRDLKAEIQDLMKKKAKLMLEMNSEPVLVCR